jgi:hypothetical protein
MYVGMGSVFLNYGHFRMPVGGVMKLSISCFGCFECNLSLAQVNNFI